MRYYEDFSIGEVIDLGSCSATREQIIEFARQFDPQPFHLDEVAAQASIFGGLVASGWHTCSMVMRQLVDHLLVDAASLGSPGMDDVRWLQPLRPDQKMTVQVTVEKMVPSRSRPDRGVIFKLMEGLDEQGELIVSMHGRSMYGRRPAN